MSGQTAQLGEAGSIVFTPIEARNYGLSFYSDGSLVMTLTKEGQLIAGEGLSQDEATQAAFEALKRLHEQYFGKREA